MKNILSIIFIVASITCFFSCSKDDEYINDTPDNTATDKEQEYITNIEIANGNLLNKPIYNFGTLEIKYEPEYLDAPICYWSSSDPKIVSVDRYTGKYSALSDGECIITATTMVGPDSAIQELTAECRIVVIGIDVDSLEFDITEKELEVGEEFTLTPYITPSNATNKKLVWESSDSTVAKVNGRGRVYAVSEGECSIYAISKKGKIAECRVTVLPVSIKKITLNVSEIKLMLGDSLKVDFNVTPSNAKITDIKWEVEDETIASVTDDGFVVCNNVGTTMLKLTLNNEKSVVCKIVGCNIDELVNLQFGSSVISSVGGYISGSIEFSIINNSIYEITAKSFQIIDGNTGDFDITNLSNKISGGAKIGYYVTLRESVYKPIFRFNFIYNGVEYYTEKQYEIKL